MQAVKRSYCSPIGVKGVSLFLFILLGIDETNAQYSYSIPRLAIIQQKNETKWMAPCKGFYKICKWIGLTTSDENGTIEHTKGLANGPVGNYTLAIDEINKNTKMHIRPVQVSYVMAEPWWRSWVFYVLLNAGLIGLGFFFTIIYIRTLKIRSAKNSRIDHMLAESRLIALRAQMNPHFIFNVINSIQYYVLQNEKDRAYDYLARFSRLMRLVLDSSQYLKIPLAREIEILKYYTELEKLRFGTGLQIEINVEVTNPQLVMIPNMIIQPYVENAIIHGLMHKKNNAVLKISIKEDLQIGCLWVVIIDNGIGRARAMKHKKSSEHISTGMNITSERLKVMQKLSDVAVNVKIIDLMDELTNPLGTRVEITIPIEEKL